MHTFARRRACFRAEWQQDITRVPFDTPAHTHTRTVLEQEVPELSAEELSKLRQYKEGGEDVERFGQV